MPFWKVLVVMAFGAICLALGLATIIVPMTLVEGWDRLLWLGGLLSASAVMGTLFALFLRSADTVYSARS